MKRIITLALTALAALVLAAPAALADSPHFLYANASVSAADGSLTVAFKDAGLGTGVSSVQVTLTAQSVAEYQCWNNGGNHPQAGNKETAAGPVTATGDFPVRNGQTTASLTAGPAGPGDFACPPGQSLYLQSADYSAIYVTDATGNTAEASPDPVGTGPMHVLVG